MILKSRRQENFNRDFPGKCWSWAWFFWRPLQEGNFEIFLETLQLHRIMTPIWFCNCKLRYTVWDILESQLVRIQLSASLKHLIESLPSSLPPSRWFSWLAFFVWLLASRLATMRLSLLVLLGLLIGWLIFRGLASLLGLLYLLALLVGLLALIGLLDLLGVSCLAGWQADWLTDWLTGWLGCWLARLTCLLAGWQGWLSGAHMSRARW